VPFLVTRWSSSAVTNTSVAKSVDEEIGKEMDEELF
jgi:hypothetical protein